MTIELKSGGNDYLFLGETTEPEIPPSGIKIFSKDNLLHYTSDYFGQPSIVYSAEHPLTLYNDNANLIVTGSNNGLPLSNIGSFNTVIGDTSAYSFTNSGSNVLIGNNVCPNATTINFNLIAGQLAAGNLQTGDDNLYLGNQCGSGITNSEQCTFIGKGSGSSVASGLTNSTAIGYATFVNVNDAVNLGSNCNVGINNSSPAYNLDIETIGTVCGICMDTSTLPANPAAGKLVLYHDGTNFKYVDSAGTVKTITAV